MEPKALPPAKINPQKLLGGSSVSAIVKKISVKPTSGEDSVFIIRKQVIQIKDLLNTNILLKKKEESVKRKEGEQKRFAEKEEKLEKTKDAPKEKFKFPSIPKLGFLERIKNFIFSIILGRIAIVLLPHLPKLSGIVGTIVKVQDTIIDWTGKILNGLVSFVDKGYEAYDQSRKMLKGIGGDGFVKVFDSFNGAVDKVIEASIIAALAFGELGGGDSGTGGGPGRGGGRPGSGGKPNVINKGFFNERTGRWQGSFTGRDGAYRTNEAARRYAQRFGRDAAVNRFGQEGVGSLGGKYARSGAENLARKGLVSLAGKGGAKAILGTVRPLLKRLPIIGALIDFGLSVALGEDPGRAAFKAIGAGLLGAVGAAAGSVVPFAGTLLGGLAGGALGDMAGGALYDFFFGKKSPPKPKVQGRAQGGAVTRAGKLQTGPSRTVKKAPKREVSVTPTPLKPGSDVGGEKNIVKIFPKRDDKDKNKDKTVNPLGYIKGVYDKTSKINYFGPLFGLVVKKMSGDKVDKVDYKNVGKSLNAWMNNTFSSSTMNVGGFAEGGEVNAQMFMSGEDLTNVIAKSVEETVSSKLDKVLDDLEKQLMLKPKAAEQKVDPTLKVPDDDLPSGMTPGKWGPLLDLIASVESGSYESLNPGTTLPGATKMTISRVASEAERIGKSKGGTGAVGRYQQLPWYLVERAKAAGLDPDKDLFSPENQDLIVVNVNIKGRGGERWLRGEMSDEQFMQGLSQEFASIPNVDGKFYYPGQGSSMSPSKVKAALAKVRGGGYSREELARSQTTLGTDSGSLSLAKKLAESMGVPLYSHVRKGDPRSYHYDGRAMDFSNDAVGNGTPQQLALAKELVKRYGSTAKEIFYTPLGFSIKDGKKVNPIAASGHYNHVHVAFKDGGKVKGLTRAILGEEGPEFVIDADSTKALELNYPGFLDALNKADYSGALKVLQNYASYETSAPIYVSIDKSMAPVLFPVTVSSGTQTPIMGIGRAKEDYMASSYKR